MECAIFYGPFFHLLHKDAIQIGAQPSVRTTQSEIFVVMHWRIGGGEHERKWGVAKVRMKPLQEGYVHHHLAKVETKTLKRSCQLGPDEEFHEGTPWALTYIN